MAETTESPRSTEGLPLLLNHTALYACLARDRLAEAAQVYTGLIREEASAATSIACLLGAGLHRDAGAADFPETLSLYQDFARRAGYEDYVLYMAMREAVRFLALRRAEGENLSQHGPLVEDLRQFRAGISALPSTLRPMGGISLPGRTPVFELDRLLDLPADVVTAERAATLLQQAEPARTGRNGLLTDIRAFIPQRLAEELSAQAALSTFVRMEHSDVGLHDYALTTGPVVVLLEGLLNQPRVLRFMEEGCGLPAGSLDRFVGRLYTIGETCGEEGWHSDSDGGHSRVLGFSLDLSPQPYSGGELALRTVADGQVCGRAKAGRRGDALAFRIHPSLEHRVMPITGEHPRIAFVGWFIGHSPEM